jgi:hypothetical protein
VSDEVTRQAAEAQAERNVSRDDYNWMVNNRNDWKHRADTLGGATQQMMADNSRLVDQRNAALAQVAIVIAERDAAELERTESRAEVVRLRVKRNEAQEERDAARAEAEGLRADLLAHPPENAARIAELQATNTALWEAQQQHQRKAEHDQMIIEGLREALERTENKLFQARSRQIPQALVGLLGVIRREAAAAEKMIL